VLRSNLHREVNTGWDVLQDDSWIEHPEWESYLRGSVCENGKVSTKRVLWSSQIYDGMGIESSVLAVLNQ